MNPHESPQKSLQELLTRYLQRQAGAHADGLGHADTTGEVEPFDAVPAQPVEPRVAWSAALEAVRHLVPDRSGTLRAPAPWPAVVSSHEPVIALPFAIGNYPQLVRDLHALWHGADLTSLRSTPAHPLTVPGLPEWAAETTRSSEVVHPLLAASLLRLTRNFEEAGRMLEECEETLPAEWRAAWENEQAALLWESGKREEAARSWQKQPESVPVLFNRGMSALFLGRREEARGSLRRAADMTREEDPWHHLALLYLALAE